MLVSGKQISGRLSERAPGKWASGKRNADMWAPKDGLTMAFDLAEQWPNTIRYKIMFPGCSCNIIWQYWAF